MNRDTDRSAMTDPEPEDLTQDDHLVTPTDNGLRPDDELLEQPSQDPAWRPDDNG